MQFRRCFFVLVFIAVVFLVGCQSDTAANQQSSAASSQDKAKADTQNQSEVSSEAEKMLPLIDATPDFVAGKKIIQTDSISDWDHNPSFESLTENSDLIVKGRITKVEQRVFDGLPWMEMFVKISEPIMGNANSGDEISIYILGGYMPLEDYIKLNDDAVRFKDMSKSEIKNTVLKDVVDGEEFPKVNQESIFFLVKPGDEYGFPKGVYNRTRGHEAQLNLQQDGKTMTRYVERELETFQLPEVKSEMKALVEEYKE